MVCIFNCKDPDIYAIKCTMGNTGYLNFNESNIFYTYGTEGKGLYYFKDMVESKESEINISHNTIPTRGDMWSHSIEKLILSQFLNAFNNSIDGLFLSHGKSTIISQSNIISNKGITLFSVETPDVIRKLSISNCVFIGNNHSTFCTIYDDLELKLDSNSYYQNEFSRGESPLKTIKIEVKPCHYGTDLFTVNKKTSFQQ